MPLLLIHFARLGPYHHARLESASKVLDPLGWEIIGLEAARSDATYAWNEAVAEESRVRVITAFTDRVHEEISAAEFKRALRPILDELKPDAIAIAGWGSTDARACLEWCKHRNRTAVVMSETREADGQRVWWKERMKSSIIQRFDGALVGGKSHLDYLIKLGISERTIRLGYNVVDNHYFAEESTKWKLIDQDLKHRPYFLASNRFIERKNLCRLVQAFSRYTESRKFGNSENPPFDLCLLGDGEQLVALFSQCRSFGLSIRECAPWESIQNREAPNHRGTAKAPNSETSTVYFPGFRQIEELPRFYAHAGCFVHPALEEPWGLVINEAMACGLPILSGHNVGAAEELVDDGVNGWCFDSESVAAMSEYLERVAGLSEDQRTALGTASTRILEERCPTAAFGTGLAEILRRSSTPDL